MKAPARAHSAPLNVARAELHPAMDANASLLQRARLAPRALGPHDVLHLQRALGNRAVGQLLSRSRVAPRRALQRMVLGNPTPEEAEQLREWVKRGEFQQVLDFVVEHLPPAPHKRGAAAVRPVADFATVVDRSEIPPHGGYANTTGGLMLQGEKPQPDPVVVYVNEAYIREWVLSGQLGSLANTIEHELTHAHQVNDPNFLQAYTGAALGGRRDAMEFET